MSKRKSKQGKGVVEDVAKLFVNIPKSGKKHYQSAVKNSNGNFAHDFAQGFAVPFKVARDTRAVSTLAPHVANGIDYFGGPRDISGAVRTTGHIAKKLGFGQQRRCQF
jgi:hypothetical protein